MELSLVVGPAGGSLNNTGNGSSQRRSVLDESPGWWRSFPWISFSTTHLYQPLSSPTHLSRFPTNPIDWRRDITNKWCCHRVPRHKSVRVAAHFELNEGVKVAAREPSDGPSGEAGGPIPRLLQLFARSLATKTDPGACTVYSPSAFPTPAIDALSPSAKNHDERLQTAMGGCHLHNRRSTSRSSLG